MALASNSNECSTRGLLNTGLPGFLTGTFGLISCLKGTDDGGQTPQAENSKKFF